MGRIPTMVSNHAVVGLRPASPGWADVVTYQAACPATRANQKPSPSLAAHLTAATCLSQPSTRC